MMPSVGRLLLAGALLGAACTSNAASPQPTTTVSAPTDGEVAIGIAVPGGRAATVRDVELATGATFEVIRTFARWDSQFPNPDQQSLLDASRRLHVSVRPVTDDGRVITWRELAEAEPGEAAHDELVGWIDGLVALGPGHFVTLNHEPETKESAANGSPEDFVAMWRRFVELLRERGGGELQTVWTMTGGAFSDDRAELWYPGDDVVDIIGADVYNWFTCQGSDRPWRSLDELIEPPLSFARDHGKPLALPEFASVEDPAEPGRKARWLNEAALTLGRADVRGSVFYVAWFDVTAPGGTWPDCVWDHDTSVTSAEAFADFLERVST